MNELYVSDDPLLRSAFHKDPRASVLQANGYQQLKSQLAPTSQRGAVLIDPPYKLKTGYPNGVSTIQESYKRFATGVYAPWYPVVLYQQVQRTLSALQQSGIYCILKIELAVHPDSDRRGMTTSSIIAINPL